MKEFLDRMIEEHKDLDMKVAKIELFKTLSKYQDLTIIEKDLLDMQLTHMKRYNEILSKRIGYYLSGGKL